ncbi:hypothetical protein [Neobacillus mesonae]|uniref:hypothetical protein n=1 Tax=Neobacillus mesonae TaxID=1193713 RepID=UPI000837686B|nr:hypothetical protein [Neobacillus mesonae]
MYEPEAWLKKMENGTIGESRTKEFLIDRFWILERSVDIEGADFIIQRRLTQKNMLDFEPTRLGFVQSKFREITRNGRLNEVKVKIDYLEDNNGNPRNEFFLNIHTGKENNKKAYLFFAEDIVNTLKSRRATIN